MGKYVNQTSNGSVGASFKDKCNALLSDGAIEIGVPEKFEENLVCVVDNGMFAAAGYCFDSHEFKVFTHPTDKREKRWFIWDKVNQFAR